MELHEGLAKRRRRGCPSPKATAWRSARTSTAGLVVLCIVVLGPVCLKRSTLAQQFAVSIISSVVAGSILTWFGEPQPAPPVPQVMTEPLQNVTAAEPRRPKTARPLQLVSLTDVLRHNGLLSQDGVLRHSDNIRVLEIGVR